MALNRGTQVKRGYATVADDSGVNYREIADTMTELGYPMNHSSARNYVLRVMKKFAAALDEGWGLDLSPSDALEVCKSPTFQHGIADVLHVIEAQRRSQRGVV
jgi:hypothetical protein